MIDEDDEISMSWEEIVAYVQTEGPLVVRGDGVVILTIAQMQSMCGVADFFGTLYGTVREDLH